MTAVLTEFLYTAVPARVTIVGVHSGFGELRSI
jgi:hypothetical protein